MFIYYEIVARNNNRLFVVIQDVYWLFFLGSKWQYQTIYLLFIVIYEFVLVVSGTWQSSQIPHFQFGWVLSVQFMLLSSPIHSCSSMMVRIHIYLLVIVSNQSTKISPSHLSRNLLCSQPHCSSILSLITWCPLLLFTHPNILHSEPV